jgi:hypothetical protein
MTEQELKALIQNSPELRYEIACELLEFCVTCGNDLDRRGLICKRCFFDGYVPLPFVEREAMRLKQEINDRELKDILGGNDAR